MLKKVKLGTKILGGFVIVLILTGVVSYVGWDGMRNVADRVKKADDTSRMIIMILQARRHEKNFILRGDKKYIEEVAKEINNLKKQANETKNKFKKPANKKQMDEVLVAADKYEKAFARLVDILGKEMKKEDREKLMKAIDDELIQGGRIVEKECTEARDDQKKQMEAQMASAIMFMIGGALVAVGLGLFIAFFMARSITKPITRVVEGLTDGADQVASASSQVSSASQSLAEGASEQAAGLEETSSSIEEMASMTRQNADNANQANTLMSETTRVVDEANHSMKELTESMKEISVASEETAKIIKTIDEIAFQTNLLALNAAVEAARAGEAGAGFAVVADEVRNLALRAADAAKNTANLIEGTVKKIKNGSDTVAKTNEAFGKVAAGSKKVGELVGEISAASNEQAQGVDQINKAVAEMDKVVQKNAASAEESASASEEMNAQAEQMKGFVAELVALVDGKGNGNGVVSMKGLPQNGGNGDRLKTVIHLPNAGIRKVLPALAKKGKGKGMDVTAHHKGREIKPDQVIPMEEGDFKEF